MEKALNDGYIFYESENAFRHRFLPKVEQSGALYTMINGNRLWIESWKMDVDPISKLLCKYEY